MFDRKIKIAIQKYLDADKRDSKSEAKEAITRLISAASATDVMSIPGVSQEFEELPNWLKLRLQKGSLYEEDGEVFGWYKDDQFQAEPLPVELDFFSYDDGNDVRKVECIKVVSESIGFCPAVEIPYCIRQSLFGETLVNVPIDDDLRFLELWGYGFASPCPLQWSWFGPGRDRWDDRRGYVVERSIICHGFWRAWKWWPGCWHWYYEKQPELFEDAKWWDENK